MKLKYIFLPAVAILCSLGSCKKYVEIKTQGNLVPGETVNYRYLLNNSSALEVGPQIGDLSSDDISYVDGSVQQRDLMSSSNVYLRNSYTWQPEIYPLGDSYLQRDNNWISMYNTIAYANTVINEVPSSNGTEAEKAELIGEALVHRADAYLMLMNTYAKPYNAATANQDLGVPLVLAQTTTQSLSRPSSAAVYAQIIADLKRALPGLTTQTINQLPSKASGYAELARCYLYMNDFQSAATYADSALAIRATLLDLGPITAISSSTYPIRRQNPEILLSKIATGGVTGGYGVTALRLSDELLSLLGTKDKRYQLFTAGASVVAFNYTQAGGRYFALDYLPYEPRNIGPTVPEMMLIKAEYLARNANAAGAMQMVNALRKKRFLPADYVDLSAGNPNEALRIVIEERRREFFCRMLRWWDMRRLKDDPMFRRTYTRTLNGSTFTLDPSSDRYTFQISPYQIQLSPEIEQNP
ncbi:RagB/SusD family nutrient uptake outer membrane protein [Pedobacter panaciterrae]|uniref:RagB/SusD family nutrient uptake outer membrane protein n=1 Tax=Pedobacter panaciterrae TaxID=363849 RepID=A0ABU8NHQ5_9SPHI